jgi:predicted amidohydrolase YtcJ
VDLDAVSPQNPVVLVRGGHSLILNSAALEKFGITRDTAVPAGGAISRDANGNLTGEIIDAAKRMVALPAPPPVTEADLLKTQRTLNRYGITAVRIPGAYKGDLLTAYGLMKEADHEGRLTLRYIVYLPGFTLQSGDEARKLIAKWNVQQDEGDDWVRIGGVKLAIDGGFEGAHMIDPYAEPYGHGGTFHGITTVTPERLRDVVMTLDTLGWRPTVHAAGDAAVAEVLDSYERANVVKPIAGRRWAIEHAHISNANLVERMKKLNVMLSVQDHLYLAAPVLKRYWGAERAAEVTPLKNYLEAGLVVAGGTDAPVIPFNPFRELYHFASRDTISDGVYGADQRILSRQQLLRLVTINYARLIGEERTKGSIETGKLADFAVLSDDFLTVDVHHIPDMHALATFVGGKEVYSDPAFQ